MSDELQALIVTRRPAREMADGTLRVMFDVEPNDRKQFLAMFPDNGDPIAIAALEREAVIAHQQGREFASVKPARGEFGRFAQWLVQSGFFRRPDVWRFAGPDAAFLEWCKAQECAVRNGDHGGDIVPAHVRRIADGAGTGIKPQYSAIPLCDKHHKAQHQHGESAIGGKEFCDRERIKAVEAWSRERFKALLGLSSLSGLSPHHFELAIGNELNVNIPAEYF